MQGTTKSTVPLIFVVFLVSQPLTCDCYSNVTLQEINALVIRNMQNQMKTMEESLKLVQMVCGRRMPRPSFTNRGSVIAFHAKLGPTVQNLPHDAKLVFSRVTLNEGSAYDGNTGVFTSPSDGVYVFEWTILTHPEKTFHLDLMVNGKTAAITHNKQPRLWYSSVSSSVVVKMKRGEQAWLEPHHTHVGEYAREGWTYFSGFKL